MLKKFGKSIVVYGIASGISKSIMIFLVPVFTNAFTTEEYGILDLITTTVIFVSILGMLQLESALSRYFFEAKNHSQLTGFVSTTIWSILILSMVFGLLLLFLSDPLSHLLFGSDKYSEVIMISCLIIPLSNIFAICTTLMRFEKKPLLYAVFVSVQLIFTVGSSIWLVVYEQIGILGAIYGQIIGFLFSSICMLWYLRKYLGWNISREVLQKFFKYSLPLVPAAAGGWVNLYINRFVMLSYLSLSEIGVYTVALKIASILKLGEQAFRMAWGPFMFESLKKENHKEIFKKVMKYACIATFLVVSVFSLFSKELLSLFATNAYIGGEKLIGLIAFSLGLTIVYQTIMLGPAIKEKTIYNTYVFIISIIVNICSLLILVPKYGLIGVPISLLISSSIMIALAWLFSERLYYIGFPKFLFAILYMSALIIVMSVFFIDLSFITKIAITMGIIIPALFLFNKIRYQLY